MIPIYNIFAGLNYLNNFMKIALLTYQKQERYHHSDTEDEDMLLLKYLLNKGIAAEYAEWDDEAVQWQQYSHAVIKSTWDYQEKYDAFIQRIQAIQAAGVKVLNPAEIISWNSDKHYLQQIGHSLPIIDSVFINKGETTDAPALFDHFKAEKLIAKPCISAGARGTFIVHHNDNQAIERLTAATADEDYIIQPFMKEIFEGEWSFIFLGGQYSHSSLKSAGKDDFRVQHYHGGTFRAMEPAEKHIGAAAAYVDTFAKGCLYARVDGLLVNDEFRLMELELIEPYLFLATHPAALNNYYEALRKFL